MSERVFVENLDQSDPFNYGIISYKVIADYIFTDLAIAGALGTVRILIDITKPFFLYMGRIECDRRKNSCFGNCNYYLRGGRASSGY